MIQKSRLKEILSSLWPPNEGQGKDATPAERAEIMAVWNKLPGHYSFYDAVNYLIHKERGPCKN